MTTFIRAVPLLLVAACAMVAIACTVAQTGGGTRALPFPAKDPATAPLPADPALALSITYGDDVFNQTQVHAKRYVGNGLNCASCHIQGGQLAGAIPLVGVATLYPRTDSRSQGDIDLVQRVIGCFERSMAGTAPPLDSPELRGIVDYLNWISTGYTKGQVQTFSGLDKVPADKRIALGDLNRSYGQSLYTQFCISCHMRDGSGANNGSIPAVWGPNSFSDGAGLAQVYKLAEFIKTAMPFNRPGVLSWEDAQHIAAYIDSQPRPVFPRKASDWGGDVNLVPVDAVYYPNRYPTNPLSGEPNRY
jgi:thiosulfate dehydrogenase